MAATHTGLLLALILPPAFALDGFLRGVDLSYLPEAEAHGAEYRQSPDDPAEDALQIVKRNGANIVRLRIWNDPPWPNQTYANWTSVLALAKRVYTAGLDVHLDFHYSDWWADPSQQWTPHNWEGLAFEDIVVAAAAFTRRVLAAAVAQGTPPAVVQTGNEITNGMLWMKGACTAGAGTWQPDDDCGDNWPHFINALNETIQAVRETSPSSKVMVHLSEWGSVNWWLDNAAKQNLQSFDLSGVSYYEQFWSDKSGGPVNTIACDCAWCLLSVQKKHPGLPIIFVETAYPFEALSGQPSYTPDYDFTPLGQARYLRAFFNLANQTFGVGTASGGSGVYWWCAECIDDYWRGFGGWDRMALFDHATGAALPAQQVWHDSTDPCADKIESMCPGLRGGESSCTACISSSRAALVDAGCADDELLAWCVAPSFCHDGSFASGAVV